MPQKWRERLAVERAEKYAPMPTGGSFMAGVCGAVVALLADAALSAFYGWHVGDHVLIAAFVAIGGFLVGFLGHRRLAGRVTRERLLLSAEDSPLQLGGVRWISSPHYQLGLCCVLFRLWEDVEGPALFLLQTPAILQHEKLLQCAIEVVHQSRFVARKEREHV